MKVDNSFLPEKVQTVYIVLEVGHFLTFSVHSKLL